MSISRLIEFFSCFTRLPVRAEDVRDQLVDMGIQEEILLKKMDVPTDELLGMFIKCRRRDAIYGQVTRHSIVFYNVNLDPDMQNVVCVKELMHVFDAAVEANTRNKSDLFLLLDHLFADQRKDPPFDMTFAGFMDDVAIALALAVLFPHEIRDDFIEAHDAGRMTHDQIAKEAGLPPPIVRELLSRKWDATRNLLMRLN